MIRVLFVAIAFLSVSAMADTGPCSAGIQDPPIFSLVLSNPVRVTFSDTVHAILSPPLLTIEGSKITLVQTAYETLVAPPASCNRQSVPLDDLAPGSYTLTWKYQTLQNFTLATYSFAFTVPAASPCVVGVSIQPQSPSIGQPVSIAYAMSFRGFLETPTVTLAGGQITIDQQAVIADPAFPGHVPCARGIVQIGALQAGDYSVSVRSPAFGPFSDAFTIRQPVRSRAVRGH
jgi:hypothetical protein